MTPEQYEEIWEDQTKWVGEDVRFSRSEECDRVYEFAGIEITCSLAWAIVLNGRHDCRTGEVTFNFVARGIGAFARYDLGGAAHKDAGRFHQHLVQTEADVRQQLPNVVRRDDLQNLTAKQIWNAVCKEASITHTGEFWDPEALC